jgi:UDP-2,3-diacylglucosamine hydrolase
LKAVFFSDVHLVRQDVEKTELFQGFLKDCCTTPDMVFVLGDLFEFYHGYDGYIYPWYKGVVDSLKELTESGKRVFFLEGNHEFGMGTFFEHYTGATCGHDMTMHLDNKKIFVSHGDASSFFCLANILKTRFVYAIMDILGPVPTWRVAHTAGFFLSRKIKPYNAKIKNIFRENARKKLDEGYDAVIYAHSHIADKIEFDREGGKKTYLNTGDFGRYLDYVSYDSSSGFTQEKYSRNVAREKRSIQRDMSGT